MTGTSKSNISGDKTINTNGDLDCWIIKIDVIGNMEWQKSFGGIAKDVGFKIIQTSDGGYLIGGDSNSDISGNKTENSKGFADYWLIKLDASGNILWQKTIGGNANDIFYSVIQTPDMGFLVGGYSYSNISGDKTEGNVGYNPNLNTPEYWFVKVDSTGTIQWDNTIGSTLSDYATTVINASDGGYLVGGYSNGNTSGDKTQNCKGGYDIWILKLDTLGNILWQKIIGGSADDKLADIIPTEEGGYLLGATSNSPISGDKTENSKGGNDYWIVKIDVSGNILWDKTIGGNSLETLSALKEDNNHNYYVGGISKSNISGNKTEYSKGGNDYWIVKTDNFGAPIWDKTIGGSGEEFNGCIDLDLDNSIIVGGASNSNISGDKTEDSRGGYDYWIVKLASENLALNTISKNNLRVFPNPTTGIVTLNFGGVQDKVTATLTNVLRQVVSNKTYYQVDNATYNITDSTGIYFLEIENENGYKKIVKLIKN